MESHALDDTDSTSTSTALGREWVYGLLGTLFDDVPDALLLNRLRDGEALRLADVARGLGVSATSTERIASVAGVDMTTLNIEYTSLFEAHKRVYPFASCWLAEKPRLMRKPWAMANAFYARFGVGLPEDRAMRADHIGTELLFVSLLASRQAAAGDSDEAASLERETERFLSLHLQTWVPDFCRKVVEDERSDYYAAFCELTAALLSAESALAT